MNRKDYIRKIEEYNRTLFKEGQEILILTQQIDFENQEWEKAREKKDNTNKKEEKTNLAQMIKNIISLQRTKPKDEIATVQDETLKGIKDVIRKIINTANLRHCSHVICRYPDAANKFCEFMQNLDIDATVSNELGSLAHLLVLHDSHFYIVDFKLLAIKELFKKGLNPNFKNEMGYTFIEAAIFGIPGCYREDEDPELATSFNTIDSDFTNDLIKMAKEFGFNVNTKDNQGNSLVHTAISTPYYCDKRHRGKRKKNIIDLIQTLGDEFDINARNNDGQDILEYLDYCINNPQLNSDCYDKEIIEIHIKDLKAEREDIRNYIMLKRNPNVTTSEIKATYLNKLDSLEEQTLINKRMSTFLGETIEELDFDLTTITLDELNSLIQQELLKTKDLVNKIIKITKEKFGIMYKEICKFVILGKETKEFPIEPIGKSLDKKSSKYPTDETIAEKITWLRDSILEYDLNQKRIADAKAKAKRK